MTEAETVAAISAFLRDPRIRSAKFSVAEDRLESAWAAAADAIDRGDWKAHLPKGEAIGEPVANKIDLDVEHGVDRPLSAETETALREIDTHLLVGGAQAPGPTEAEVEAVAEAIYNTQYRHNVIKWDNVSSNSVIHTLMIDCADAAIKAAHAVRTAPTAEPAKPRRYVEYGQAPGEYHGVMKPKSVEPKKATAEMAEIFGKVFGDLSGIGLWRPHIETALNAALAASEEGEK